MSPCALAANTVRQPAQPETTHTREPMIISLAIVSSDVTRVDPRCCSKGPYLFHQVRSAVVEV